jgi:hypothetical protein
MAADIGDPMARAELLAQRAATVFQPRTPITTKELFAGRWNELTGISDAVHQAGLHVVIYGERGVGKTSLANVVRPTIWVMDRHGVDEEEQKNIPERLVLKAVANSGDTFSTLWHRLLGDVQWPHPNDPEVMLTTKVAFGLVAHLTVDDVRRVLANIPGAVFIIDEFDQAPREASKAFTELIKALSDLNVDCTVILVGVSETVGNLVEDHASIDRAITQVRLDRMTADELRQIIGKAEKTLEIKFDDDAARLVVHVSQGLPHYTHLIGLHAVRSAAHRWSLTKVERDDVFDALKKAVKQAEQTVTGKHSTAIHSSQKTALYRQVLFACALAAARSHDSLGYFSASAVVGPLGDILGKSIAIANFTNHLREFCEEKRGSVLERDGQPWGYRYRFRDPLLVPFVFMDGMEAGLTSGQGLVQLLSDEPGFIFPS